jgi:hypothetical protein
MTHYIPENNVYIYFRHNDQKYSNGDFKTTAMRSKKVSTKRFAENIQNTPERYFNKSAN